MRSKKYTTYLTGCLIVLSIFMVSCDKRHKIDNKNLDHKADVDETVNGNNIPATQGNAGDTLSNTNPTIDLNPSSGTSAATSDSESGSATQSDCSREYSTRCGSSASVATPTPTPVITATASGSVVTLAEGLNFFRPTNPAVVRCGSLINKNISGASCSVNNTTGATQPLGMIMKMKNVEGTTGPTCPKVCMCTGENLEMSGWNCQQLPEEQSYKTLVQGCGARIKVFYQGTENETICSVNKGGAIAAKGTVKGMKLFSGKQSVCEEASCVCKGKVTLNRKYSGWRCALASEAASN